jgi:hypothetical protein
VFTRGTLLNYLLLRCTSTLLSNSKVAGAKATHSYHKRRDSNAREARLAVLTPVADSREGRGAPRVGQRGCHTAPCRVPRRAGRASWWEGVVVGGRRGGRASWWEGVVVGGRRGGRASWWEGVAGGRRRGRPSWWERHAAVRVWRRVCQRRAGELIRCDAP